VWAPFVDAGMPARDTERVAALIGRMRPRAQAAADAALALATQRRSDEVFTESLERLAKRRRRRATSGS